MATSAQLERKADRARERLSDRINDLRYHVSPSTVVSDLLGGVNPRAGRGCPADPGKTGPQQPDCFHAYRRRRGMADFFRGARPDSQSLVLRVSVSRASA